jgi:phosphoglycerate dehydrogenase-like enzyme
VSADPAIDRPRCAVLPRSGTDDALVAARHAALVQAVEEGGGVPSDVADADALVWTDAQDPGELRSLLDAHPRIRWVQLPWAGIEPFVDVLDHDRAWTCGKGVYAEPVAEHALALALAGLRHLGAYARAGSWSGPVGRNLLGARVTIVGGGEITRSLTRLLGPFGVHLTVVRRRPDPIEGVDEVVGTGSLLDALAVSDLVVLALALTPETERLIDDEALDAMPDHAWLVNVARGQHVDTDALVRALRDGTIGGAALDVTDPEPLPDDHPLWELPNAIVTPHTANTPEMGRTLLAARVRDNVRRFAAGDELLGPVHVELGY